MRREIPARAAEGLVNLYKQGTRGSRLYHVRIGWGPDIASHENTIVLPTLLSQRISSGQHDLDQQQKKELTEAFFRNSNEVVREALFNQ